MMKRTLFFAAAVIAAVGSFQCKKKNVAGRAAQAATDQPVATAYAIRSAIAIQDAPTVRGKAIGTLPIGNKVEVFATRVPDQKDPEKVFWYKIRYAPLGAAGEKPQMPVEGFIPEREEVLRENFLVFEKRTEMISYRDDAQGKTEEVKEPLAVMATTVVNLRKTPALNGEKIRTLKNGEVLSVLEQSTRSLKVDGQQGSWYLVKAEAGETGYAFGGFLVEGSLAEMGALKDVGFQFVSGWMVASGTTPVYKVATGNARIDTAKEPSVGSLDWEKNKGNLPAGLYVRVDGVTTKAEKPRYRFVISIPEMGPDRYYYVDKKKVKFVKDYYAVSKTQPHKLDPALADDLNRYAGGDLNAQCTKATEFTTGGQDAPRRFLAIEAHFGPGETNEESCFGVSRRFLFAELGDDKRIFREAPVKSGEFVDLDGDQVPELVSSEHTRGAWSLDVFALGAQRLTPVIQLQGGYEGGHDGGIAVGFAEVRDKLLYVSGPYMCTDAEQNEENKKICREDTVAVRKKITGVRFDPKYPAFPFYGKLENGKFVQVAAPAGN